MQLWQGFIILGIFLIAGEIAVPGFILAPIGVAALLTAVPAYFVESVVLNLLIFALLVALIFAVMSKWNLLKFAKPAEHLDVGVAGRTGTIVEASESYVKPGKVKVLGDTWEIFWETDSLQLVPIGTQVRIVKVVGNKVQIEKS